MAINYRPARADRDPRRVWLKEEECERLTKPEYEAVRCLLGAVSYMASAKDALEKRALDRIPHGKARVNMVLGGIRAIADDIVGTIPVRQCQQIMNMMKDMEIRMVPKMTPSNSTVMMSEDIAMELTDLARAACADCVMDGKECMNCALYRIMEAITPLDDYGDGLMCPYALTEWDKKKKEA